MKLSFRGYVVTHVLTRSPLFFVILEARHHELCKERFHKYAWYFLCIHLHMYKYTHTHSLLSQFTLYTLLFLCSSKCTDFFLSQFSLYPCSFSVHIQSDSGGICNTLGNDSMSDSKQKSSYEHGSDFERLRSYGHFLIPVHALI